MLKHYGPLLRMLHSAIDQSINATVESMELTSAQGHIVMYVSRRKTPPCPKDIEEAFRLSHPTVSGLLARLEKKGFVEIRPDEADRRCKRIQLLPKGKECVARIHQAIMDTEGRVVAGFSPEEQELFRSLLGRAISNLDAWPQCQNQKEEPKK